MASVTLRSLRELESRNRETLFVLLRFYFEIDTDIPEKFRPVLLGQKEFHYVDNPKGFAENIAAAVMFFLRPLLPQKSRYVFMEEKPNGDYLLLTSTREALEEYVAKYSPLDRAVYMTNEEWFNSAEYKLRYGKWSDSW